MLLLYITACVLLSVAAIQGQKAPAHVTGAAGSIAIGVVSLASVAVIIAGFFYFDWWAPIAAFVLGPIAYGLLPGGLKASGSPLALVCGAIGLALAAAVFLK